MTSNLISSVLPLPQLQQADLVRPAATGLGAYSQGAYGVVPEIVGGDPEDAELGALVRTSNRLRHDWRA